MTNVSFTETMAEDILQHDDSSMRFERFCVALFSDVDGVEYVGTSATHDLGRDGRSTSLRSAGNPPLICSTLGDDFKKKAQGDLKRILESRSPDSVRLCFAKKMSEMQIERVRAAVIEMSTALRRVQVDGGAQLAQLAVRHPSTFERHYGGEILVLKEALLTDGDSEELQITGMRIALTTQLRGEAVELREDLTRNLVLTALGGKRPLNVALIVKGLSELLHLPRVIHEEYVAATIVELTSSGHIEEVKEGEYSITDTGRSEVNERLGLGSRNLLEGRQLVRRTISDLLGEDLPESDFARLWMMIQDSLANMFMSNGIRFVEAVASIIEGESRISEERYIQESVADLGRQVEKSGIGGTRGSEVGVALVDMFHEKSSPLFDWLTNLCSVYVGVCSLGLEPLSQSQVVARLREMDLFFDTDVLLSYLSEGEIQHNPIRNIVRAWRRIEGRVCVCTSVLNEAAAHAWLAEATYEDTWRLLPKLSDSDSSHLLDNAFVRGFRVAAKRGFGRRQWKQYISEFRGTDKEDYRKIVEIVGDEGIQFVDEEGINRGFAGEVAKVVRRIKRPWVESEEHPRQNEDMAQRDGQVVATLLKIRERKRAGQSGSAVLVSSSTALRRACGRFADQLGDPEPVIPIGAVGFLLGLIPGVAIPLSSLSKVLFDPGFATRLDRLETLALRVIKGSKQYSLGWSRRGTLKREMRNSLAKVAKERGEDAKKLERQVTEEPAGEKEVLAEVIADAVDRLVPSRNEAETERRRHVR